MNKRKKSEKKTIRAKGKTQISISLPQDLVNRIDVLAENENRNRSNYITTVLTNISN
ncbi:ribbon-helix-helix protein, CopG family [Cerasicoccus arenae]|uniref:Ribbon-helix-helix protein CopG domain-containing protein n=1 Tax=Cerasicoccus arenae TaxID=424488 RepID=A0A8J3GDV4_9BACT|nr:ribbon-helix-helix protein, CopG family [Cerasicoccus arenae]MBK1858692.1 ribbon-helix-helix protein, CopG family [Cerasicoccus arenae]GHB98349.1 hypothetical protein GCM10007047_13030 [Cerasicoccus arenae]